MVWELLLGVFGVGMGSALLFNIGGMADRGADVDVSQEFLPRNKLGARLAGAFLIFGGIAGFALAFG